MFAALAQLERDTIVERTTAGRNERGKRDGERGGRVPLGYRRLENGMIEVDTESAVIVRNIFSLRRNGLTLRQIADQLNAANIPNARSQHERYITAKWHASTVKSILDNEVAYKGGTRGTSQIQWQAIL